MERFINTGMFVSMENSASHSMKSKLAIPRRKLLLVLTSIVLLLLLPLLGASTSLQHVSHSFASRLKAHEGQSAPDLFYRLNHTKIATIIEPRNLPVLLPLLHNYITVLPPDWPIEVWCTSDNFDALANTRSLTPYIMARKLRLRMLPDEYHNMDMVSLSHFMISPWFWQQYDEAEWMLVLQTDAVLCSRSTHSVDDYVGYDLVGHPIVWAVDGRGGNGGMSMRRISSMLRIALAFEERLRLANRKKEYLDYFFWYDNPDRDYLFCAEDAFFAYALMDEEKKLGEASGIRWPVQDGRSQSEFAFDVLGYEDRTIEDVRPVGVHTGGGSAGYMIEYNGAEYSPQSEAWMKYCPELAYLKFIPR